jgi:hypothetical protein
MADDTLDQPMRAPQAPVEVAALNAWMDAQLGRPLTIVALRRAGDSGADPLAGWRAQLPQFPLARLLEEQADEEQADEAQIGEALARISQLDPDVLLVCDEASGDADAAQHWRAAILDIAEGRNLFERMEIALVGAGMTRPAARARGFEDGFASDHALAETLAILAREAVTRAAYRRYGSSPPCYL